jgi:hypothetical protein
MPSEASRRLMAEPKGLAAPVTKATRRFAVEELGIFFMLRFYPFFIRFEFLL